MCRRVTWYDCAAQCMVTWPSGSVMRELLKSFMNSQMRAHSIGLIAFPFIRSTVRFGSLAEIVNRGDARPSVVALLLLFLEAFLHERKKCHNCSCVSGPSAVRL